MGGILCAILLITMLYREIPPDDRRATYAVLTDAGREAAERGFPIYTELQTKLFQEHVTDEEAEMLVRIWNRVLDANGSPCEPISSAAAELAT